MAPTELSNEHIFNFQSKILFRGKCLEWHRSECELDNTGVTRLVAASAKTVITPF